MLAKMEQEMTREKSGNLDKILEQRCFPTVFPEEILRAEMLILKKNISDPHKDVFGIGVVTWLDLDPKLFDYCSEKMLICIKLKFTHLTVFRAKLLRFLKTL